MYPCGQFSFHINTRAVARPAGGGGGHLLSLPTTLKTNTKLDLHPYKTSLKALSRATFLSYDYLG